MSSGSPVVTPAAPDRAITPAVVREIAVLARLRLPDAELGVWSRQLSRIVEYIGQLEGIPESAFQKTAPGPATPLRDDAARPGHGDEALAANAPRQMHGFGVVPRVVGQGS